MSRTPVRINQDASGLNSDDSNMSADLPSILHLSGLLYPCLGFNKTSHHCKVLRHLNEEQAVIEIDVNGDAQLISKACEENGFCKSCYLAKERLRKRKAEFKNIYPIRS